MDAQRTPAQTAALVAAVQTIAHLELEEGYHPPELIDAAELLHENRFIAARDGMDATLIDPVLEVRVPAREQLADLMAAGLPHAQELGCEHGLRTARGPGAHERRDLAAAGGAGLRAARAGRGAVVGIRQAV